jgi:hypothetical protein
MQRPGAAPQTSIFGWCWRRSPTTTQKTSRGGEAAPNLTAGGGRCNSPG